MNNESYNKKQCGTVRINVIVPFIGIIGSLFFGIVLILSFFNRAEFLTILIFGIFLLLSLIMTLTANQKIDYTPLGFYYRDMFRITHEYNYSQIKKISYGKDSFITVGYRIILIDSMAANSRKFVRIAMQYSRNAEIKTESQSKLFNGNIKSPGEFIFIWFLFIAAILAFMFWGIYVTRPVKMEDLSSYSDTIASYKFDSENDEGHKRLIIKLASHPETFFTWELDDASANYENLEKDVSDKNTIKLCFLQKDLKEEKTRIYMLSSNENTYITLDKTNANNKELRFVFIVFTAISLTIWIIYIIASVYVMNHAEKYPKAIKWFVKPSYIIKKKKN